MDKQHDSTTRTKLAGAINSVVAMSPAETEGMIDAVLGFQDDKAESKTNTDDRVYELQIHLEDIAGVASIAAEACDDPALNGTFNTIERECHAVREGLDAFLGNDTTRQNLDTFVEMSEAIAPQECAARLRKYNYDVAEFLASSMSEDGYTVTKTFTRKGLRHLLAELMFLESLLPDEAP